MCGCVMMRRTVKMAQMRGNTAVSTFYIIRIFKIESVEVKELDACSVPVSTVQEDNLLRSYKNE